MRLKLHQTKDNYQRVTEDFNKAQDKLLLATTREADSQESLTIMVLVLLYNRNFVVR